MTRIVISHFKNKGQERIKFVQVLSYFTGIGLKTSKLYLDEMLNGIDIEIEIEDTDEFLLALGKLGIAYEIQQL
jgi:hypothetical protein